MMQKERIQLKINGEPCEFLVEPNTLLVNLLRNEMELTGTKYGCGTGQCGGCTVLVNGEPVLSCLTLAIAVDGADILTIEGVAEPDGTLDSIQEAFLDTAAVQCGYCTPGMILMAKDLLNKNPAPSEDQIREHIKGNLCRCTGYHRIVQAIKMCAK
jgi:carbon-monoxide dehydrogenase small subunit